MNPITLDELLSKINDWCNEIFSDIPDEALPFFSSGGWEGWLQVELAMRLTWEGYDVVRESQIYDNGKKADIVFNDNCSDTNHPRIVVEIKCQSIYKDINSFSGLISKDIDKLSGLPNDYVRLMLVAAVDQEFAQHLTAGGFEPCSVVRDAIALFVMRV